MASINIENLPSHSVFNKDKFTCLGCQISFPTQQMQRLHMKTEWHRYNLKRRVANLPCVSAEIFEQKVAIQKKSTIEVDEFGFVVDKDHLKSQRIKGKAHLKSKQTPSASNRLGTLAYESNLSNSLQRDLSPARSEVSQFSIGTLSHSEKESEIDDAHSEYSRNTDLESVKYYLSSNVESDADTDLGDLTDEEEPTVDLPLEECFYCGEIQHDVDSNIKHMSKWHGLHIPYPEELIDRDGLLRVLADAVGIERTCLKCGYEGSKLIGIRQHIRSKGHAVIPYETREERSIWERFYQPDDEEEVDENDEDNDGNDDTHYTTATIDSTGVELSLPNGAKLGHRLMARYYKQSIPLKTQTDESNVPDDEQAIAIKNQKAQEILHLRELLVEKSEAKRLGTIEIRERSKNLSANALKYRNNIENYRNQRFG